MTKLYLEIDLEEFNALYEVLDIFRDEIKAEMEQNGALEDVKDKYEAVKEYLRNSSNDYYKRRKEARLNKPKSFVDILGQIIVKEELIEHYENEIEKELEYNTRRNKQIKVNALKLELLELEHSKHILNGDLN